MTNSKFEVKGYVSYAGAVKQGQKVGDKFPNARWVVIALETGRFTPVFLYSDKSDWHPIQIASYPNCCVMNA